MSQIKIIGEYAPIALIELDAGEQALIQRGSMVFKDPSLQLTANLNAEGNLLSKTIKSVARSIASSESAFVTRVTSSQNGSKIGIAPSIIGSIEILDVGQKQYRLNDGAFLAAIGNANYQIKTQGFGKALFGKTGGFFIMETTGQGKIVIESFGNIIKVPVNGTLTVDNDHVVAWDANLDYQIKTENGIFHSIGTGEGLVNTFTGIGDVYIQTVSLNNFGSEISKYIPISSN